MTEPRIETPAKGSRIVKDDKKVILFGQPPDIVKGLLRCGIHSINTIVLSDIKEKNGALLNNLEFPLYFFLFFSKGLSEHRKLNLIGDPDSISHALRLLRITLNGPTRKELDSWQSDEDLKNEWLNVSEELALKNEAGKVIPVADFFNLIPFTNNQANVEELVINRLSDDYYQVINNSGEVYVDLNEDTEVSPPYPVISDYVPGGLNKFSLEVLGGASGFSTNEPCTGLALCFNGDYILIDSIPFLNQHLFARGISKNQISAVFLTHLHDDHCSMFPLMEMPHRVSLITTEEIYNMSIEKLSCSLGWKPSVIEEHFQLIKVEPGKSINYFGLNIDVHTTVHTIPTIGATFSTSHKGKYRDICIVGDNQNMEKIIEMHNNGIVRQSTIENLQRLFKQRFHMLIADGGSGEIHGDPSDALNSQSDRVVFVHVDEVPELLKATFSLVSSGKRYTILEGDNTIYTTQINHFLTQWLGQPLPNRWLYNLLTEQEIYRYNSDDVIIVQGTSTPGSVYLLLTGYCEVVQITDEKRITVAQLQAGDVIGEMAILTGSGTRNASVIAKTPVTVCAFAEETFSNFIHFSNLKKNLAKRWGLRPIVKLLPQFENLSSIVIDKILQVAEKISLEKSHQLKIDNSYLYIFIKGEASIVGDNSGYSLITGEEMGWIPFKSNRALQIEAKSDSLLIRFKAQDFRRLLKTIPQLNYQTRKRHLIEAEDHTKWLLGEVSIY